MPDRHTLTVMDLLAGCAAFAAVSDTGSFTIGAARIRIPQSVASRRVAALEADLGGRLLDRTGRRATLTPFGAAVLPRARRLVDDAAALRRDAARARTAPFRLALPVGWPVTVAADLALAARAEGLVLDLQHGDPADRDRSSRVHDVDAALTCVPADQATWSVRLGAGTRPASPRVTAGGAPTAGAPDRPGASPRPTALRLASFRADRSTPPAGRRRLWLEPEDDVPTVRDAVLRSRDATGLAADQVVLAPTLTAAVTEVLGSDDALLCTERQAVDLRLRWRPLTDLPLVRGYALRGPVGGDVARVAEALAGAMATALGAEAAP